MNDVNRKTISSNDEFEKILNKNTNSKASACDVQVQYHVTCHRISSTLTTRLSW